MSTLSSGQKGCAYSEKCAYHGCAHYESAQYLFRGKTKKCFHELSSKRIEASYIISKYYII